MKQLIQKKLMWGVIVIVTTQILGMLPALDFMPMLYLKITSFALGVILTIAKGIEMFFDQSAQLESREEKTSVTTSPSGAVTASTSVTTTPVSDPSDKSVKNALLSILIAVLIMPGSIAVCLSTSGCTTTQRTVAYNSLYSVEKVTTGAYDSYLDSVIQGISTTNGVPRVSKAYNHFHASFLLALDSVQFNTNAIAPASLVVESGDIINLIQTVKGK